MTSKVKRIVNLIGVGLVVIVLLAANIVAGLLYQMITEFFHGTGISFAGEELQEVLNSGNELCSEIEGEGVVLLKGDRPPLKDVSKVNVFGWAGSNAGWTISGYGSGAARIPAERQIMLYRALTENGIEYNTELEKIYTDFRTSRTGLTSLNGSTKFFTLFEPDASVYTDAVIQRAKDFSNTAIVVLGRQSGEGIDIVNYQQRSNDGSFPASVTDTSRSYLALSREEEDMLDIVKANFGNIVVLLNTTNIMEAGFLQDDSIGTAYWVGAPGQSGTTAIPKVLKGEINPSGRTTETWAYDHKSDPSYVNSASWGASSGHKVTYIEDIYVGYKWYETADAMGYWNEVDNTYGKGYNGVVQYPFGYGRSYTTFSWEFATSDGSDPITPAPDGPFNTDEDISVTVRVTNTGDVAGKDVVQLYFTPPYNMNGIEKASINLAAFAKTQLLQPGQSEYLTLTFEPYTMASYDAYDRNHNRFNGYELDKGEYVISIAHNAHDIVDTFKYKLEKNEKFRNDPVTGTVVGNLFTGAGAYGGAPIDASDVNGSITYLTRADFVGSFPTTRYNAAVNNVSTYVNDKYNGLARPTTGASGDLRLITSSTGDKLTKSQLNSPDSNCVYNEDLVMALGGDYDSPQWDSLLDQMSYSDMENLIMLGGYHTEAIESIGKIWVRENDGPMGLTRSNASTNEVTNWTWYPMVGVLSASWNSRLAYRFGNVVAAEANYTGVHGWYAPGFNIIRSPYGGRNNEYYSEDPVFSGLFGMQTVRGALTSGVSCYIKHFIVNETETGRSGLMTFLTEQNLREIYLKPFEIAVKKGKANGVMSSFNRLGTIWAGGNYALLTSVLRDEWGFRGGVVTDWMTDGTGYSSANQGVHAGNSLWLTGSGLKINDLDSSDAATVACMRMACKDILYQFCNTYYQKQTHDPAEDEFVVDIGILEVNKPFPSWIFLLVGLDVIVLSGCAVWVFFVFKKKKPKAVKSAVNADIAAGEAGDATGDADDTSAGTADMLAASGPEEPAPEPVKDEPVSEVPATEPEEPAPEPVKDEPVSEVPATEPEEPAPEPEKGTTEEPAPAAADVAEGNDNDNAEPDAVADPADDGDDKSTVTVTVKFDKVKGNWVVVRSDSDRAYRRTPVKNDAITAAKSLAEKLGAKLIVLKKDGKFQKNP